MPPDILNQTVKTPAGDAPVVPILIVGLGAYLTWFGVHYWRSDTAWPSDPLKAVLTGKPVPVPETSADEAAIKSIVDSAGGTSAGTDTSSSGSGSGGHTTLSKDQLKKLWTDNGGASSKAALAAAVAMAESSGRTWITSSNPDGGTNVGLWQLDTKGVGAGHSVTQLQNPATNARITVMATANGTNWSHWEAFTKGAYKQYL